MSVAEFSRLFLSFAREGEIVKSSELVRYIKFSEIAEQIDLKIFIVLCLRKEI